MKRQIFLGVLLVFLSQQNVAAHYTDSGISLASMIQVLRAFQSICCDRQPVKRKSAKSGKNLKEYWKTFVTNAGEVAQARQEA